LYSSTLINEANRNVATSHDLYNMLEVVCHRKRSFDVAFKLRVISRAEASPKSAKLNIHDDGNGMHNSYIHCLLLFSQQVLRQGGESTPPYTQDTLF